MVSAPLHNKKTNIVGRKMIDLIARMQLRKSDKDIVIPFRLAYMFAMKPQNIV